MSLAEDFSRESRSYFSRSSSFANLHQLSSSYSSSNLHRTSSSTIIDRDFLRPAVVCHYLDDPFYLQRRSRFIDDFDRRLTCRVYDDVVDSEVIKHNSVSVERSLPIGYREYHDTISTTRRIPIQFAPVTTIERREKVYKKLDDYSDWSSNSFHRTDESFHSREGRHFAADNWSKQESPVRKRSSITIFVRQPHIQYSDSLHRQRKVSIPEYYSSTSRINFH